jgi:hypothetical protein
MLAAAGNSPVLPGGGQLPQTMPLVPGGPAVPAFKAPQAEGAEAVPEEEEPVEVLEEVEELGELEPEEVLDGVEPAEVTEGVEKPGTEEAEPEDPAEVEELTEAEELADVEEPEEAEELEAAEVEELNEAEEPAEMKTESAGGNAASPPAKQPSVLQAPKKSNIQLVFGDDDIPTIVESSGLELVDDIDMDSGAAGEEPETPDEVEELEDLEELEAAPAAFPGIPSNELDVASRIEFESPGDDSAVEVSPVEPEFEIVSPFTDMLSKLDDRENFKVEDETGPETKTSGRLEELNADTSLSLVHVPFQNEEQGEPEELISIGPGIIKQKNGVNYVDKKVKTPDEETAKSLDPGLKNLVDSVLK